jgi:RNA repair pathway DNA polymerase beta family
MNKIIEIKFGSHLYGTDTPASDLDFKGIYLPEARDIILGRARHNVSTSRPKQEFERNTRDDIDTEIFSLAEFMRLLCDGQTVALDMFFSPESFHVFKGERYDIFKTIYDNKDRLLSKGILSFIGYARKQASKYGIKGSRVRAVKDTIDFLTTLDGTLLLREIRPQLRESGLFNDEFINYVTGTDQNGGAVLYFEVCGRKFQLTNSVKYSLNVLNKIYDEYGQRARLAETNDGIDFKALSHAVRVNFEGQELLKTGFITFPCPNRQLLLDIKTGRLPYKEVERIIEEGLRELEGAQANSSLRDEPDRQWVDDFIYGVYSDIVKKGEQHGQCL